MKSSVHLLYGIIIGILLMACSGSDNTTSNTATPTSSSKGVQDVRIVDVKCGVLLDVNPTSRDLKKYINSLPDDLFNDIEKVIGHEYEDNASITR